jgi:hypothetical protein
MNKRERMLAGAVLVLVVAFGGVSLFKSYSTSINSGQSKLDDAQKRLAEANRALALGRRAAHKIADLKTRSMPSDRDKALSLYKAWLLAKASSAGLKVNDINLAPRTTPSTAFDAIGYSIDATGSLSSVVSMLYEFYSSPQLQQITRLRLTRPPGATQLNVVLEVEALCLAGAVATDALPEGDAKRLKLASAAEYQKSLGERDMGTVYAPPRPPAPPTVRRETPPPAAPPKFDEAELARLSGTINIGDGWQAWIYIRSTGETLHLMAGDTVKVGALEGTIESVEDRSLVLKTGDKKFRVALGQSLRSGKELDADGNVKPIPPTEPPKS